MKKNLLSILCLVSLVGCNGVSTSSLPTSPNSSQSSSQSSTSTETTTSTSTKNDVDAEVVIEKLATGPISVDGNYTEIAIMDTEEYEVDNYDIYAVLTDNYYYNETINPYFGVSRQRIDKEEDGRSKVVTLDPLTNTVVDNYLGDSAYGYYAFTDLFTNPFIQAKKAFQMEDGKVSLVDFENMNTIFLKNIFTGGSGFSDVTDFKSMSIGFDANYNPTTIEIVFENNAWKEYGQVNVCTYTGTFTELDESKVAPIPKVRETQEGHDALKDMFAELQKGNYTMTVTATQKIDNPEEWGDELPEPRKATSYISEDGYYNEYISGFYGQASDGKYMTDEGLVEFTVTEEGTVKETRKPYSVRTVDTYFGFAWNYAAESFDVNDDGSYTLANEEGFYNYVWTDLLPDFNAVSVGIMDPGSLTMTIDSANNKFTYTYSCSDGYEIYTTEITNIGSTSLPFNESDVIKYVGYSNWTEYCASSSWNEEFGLVLDDLTCGARDDIPYIENPYNYQRSYDGEFDYNWDVFPFETTVLYVSNVTMVWEFDTTYEMVNQMESIYDQLASNSNYTYNKYEDTFYYKNGDAEFSLTLKTSNGFMSMDGLFNRAIMMEIVNLREYNPEA